MRISELKRKTAETDITLRISLDGTGIADVQSGCGFMDHMLTLFAKHGKFDLYVRCDGDTDVDFHHSIEDIGITLGKAFAEALGNMAGICRFASTTLPMDEALIMTSVDISGRSYLSCDLQLPTQKVGDFDTELTGEFLEAFVRCAGITLHIRQLAGYNSHHIIEGCFKSLARTLRSAVKIDPELAGEIPSTKGVL